MTTPDSTKTYHEQVKKFFEQTAETQARQAQFVQRDSPLNGTVFLLSLVLTVFQHGTIVLDRLAQAAHQLNPKITVKGGAFKARFNAYAVAFLKTMFAEALQLSAPAAPQVVPLLTSFSAVYLLDSSVVTLPDNLKQLFLGCGGAGAQAAAKVFLLLNWLTGSYESLQLADGRKADQNMGEPFLPGRQAGALWLFDLGFFKAAFLAAIAKAKSFFVCRLPAAQQSFWVRNRAGVLEKFDLDHFLRFAPRELFEIEVVFGAQQEVSARLILAPVPKQVAAQRRRKVREAARTQRRTPRQRTLQRCDWTLLLTNARAAQLPTSTVLTVYGVRWQVELTFKLFKSDAKLETTLATEQHRVACEFYAKLIAVLVFNRLSGLATELVAEPLSAVKLWRQMRGDFQALLQVLGRGTSAALRELLQFLGRFAQPTRRQKYPTTRQRLALAACAACQVKLNDPLGYLQEKQRDAAPRQQVCARYLVSYPVTLKPAGLGFQRTIAVP